MYDAIEYADERGLMIELVPDEEDIRNNVQFGVHYHPEIKEKSHKRNQ